MKLKFIILILSVLLTAIPGYTNEKKKDQKEKQKSEQLAVKQACYIANELELQSEATQKFIDAYTRYQQEVKKLGPAPKWGNSTPCEDEAERIIKARLDNSEKLIKLRKKYYLEYSKFLTQQQIWKVYQLEDKVMKRFRSQSRKSVTHLRKRR